MPDSPTFPRFQSAASEPTHLYLVRHGQTTGNQDRLLHGRTDSALSDLGIAQAERVADRLKSETRIDAIVTSPLIRASGTANQISTRFGIETTIQHDLVEMDFGDLEGYTFERVVAEYPELARKALDPADQTLAWPNGESRAGFHRRVRAAFKSLVQEHAGQRVVVVSHNGVLGSFLAQVQGESPDNWTAFRIANCSLSSLQISNSGATVYYLNDVAHLANMVTMITADTLKAP